MNDSETMNAFARKLRQFAEDTGIGSLIPDDQGGCRLMIDDRMTLDIDAVPEERAAYLHAPLGAVPPDADAALFRSLLEAGLFGSQTSGAAIGIDPDSDELILFRSLPLSADYADFKDAFSDFVDALGTWRSRADTGNLAPHHDPDNDQQQNSNHLHAIKA